jgi:eukaryotic-like serine/threonine-protein kinase
MATPDVLVLADDALLLAVRDLSPALRKSLRCDDDDYVISRPGWRSPSLLVDRAAVTLVASFRQPKSIIAAVLSYSQSADVDPHRVLGEAYPILRSLLQAGVLVPVQSVAVRPLTPSLSPGELFATVEVRHAVQILSDTEVYQATADNGATVALKVARADASASANHQLQHEAEILDHLRGTISPALYDAGTCHGRRYVAMAWGRGLDLAATAAALRTAGDYDHTTRLRRLCEAVLYAYARLHEQGVVHADIHPRNVLVEGDRDVTILDFGLARRISGGMGAIPPRRGVSFYFEPEYATAQLWGATVPAATALAEQYALAALLYRLLTGVHYLDFRLDAELFRQISEEPPLAFASRGCAAWGEGEAVLARALQKDPVERFESVAEFADRFQQACMRSSTPPAVGSRSETQTLVKTVVERLGTDPARAALSPPTASLHYGAAGIAYMFYRLACLNEDPAFLAVADMWAERALRESLKPEGFFSAELARTNGGPGPISLYHTVSGVHLVRGIVSSAQADWTTTGQAVREFCAAGAAASENVDATLGQASVLLGCAHLLPGLPASAGADAVLDLGHNLHRSIWARLNSYGDVAASDSLTWLGIAHGWAGALYATLRWLQVTDQPPAPTVINRLDELHRTAEPTGHGLRWPRQSTTPSPDRRPTTGWCHGSAGYVHLWNLAEATCPDKSYRDLAERAAWHTWEAPVPLGASLCCGYGGQAYALLSMYRCTGDPVWRARASNLVERAAGPARRTLRLNSLYAGDVGIALLAAEVQRPEIARMPAFEAED